MVCFMFVSVVLAYVVVLSILLVVCLCFVGLG